MEFNNNSFIEFVITLTISANNTINNISIITEVNYTITTSTFRTPEVLYITASTSESNTPSLSTTSTSKQPQELEIVSTGAESETSINNTSEQFLTLKPVSEIRNLQDTNLLRAALHPLKGVSGIYCLKCETTGAIYIGSAVDLAKRLAKHLFYGKTNSNSNNHLQRAITLYGLEQFTIQILEYCALDELVKREQHFLDWLFSLPSQLRYNFCYNPRTRKG
jgi:hypothetical protein